MKLTIKQYRLMYGLRQEDLADVLGISAKQYRLKEVGEARFYIDEYRKLFDYFNKFNKLDAGKFFLEA